MNRIVTVLVALLVAQGALALFLNMTGDDYSAYQPEEKLLTVDLKTVNSITIEDADKTLRLEKSEKQWQLPALANFPVSEIKFEQVLGKLNQLEKGWPGAKTEEAAERFKVSTKQFERKLTLYKGEKAVQTLFIGTSPGFRKVHVRIDGDNNIYTVEFSAFELSANANDWANQSLLHISENELIKAEFPSFTLKREGDIFIVENLKENEVTAQQEARALAQKSERINYLQVLGDEEKESYNQSVPEFAYILHLKDGEQLTCSFSKPEGWEDYVLKRSDLGYFFKVSSETVKQIKGVGRGQLVTIKEEQSEPESNSLESTQRSADKLGD